MDSNDLINSRQKKLNELKTLVKETDEKVLKVVKALNWDYLKLLKDSPDDMVTCSINSHHTVPLSRIDIHEKRCAWRSQVNLSDEKPFSECSDFGFSVTLTSDVIRTITVILCLMPCLKTDGTQTTVRACADRAVPDTSAQLDQNFNREEKLALYDYVVANTQKPKSFSYLNLENLEKKEEKKEMAEWEIAAAERDAKRRRTSYRNKVHTNRKSHTEILKEVIDIQMEALKKEIKTESSFNEKDDKSHKKQKSKHKKHKRNHKEREEDISHSRSDYSSRDDDDDDCDGGERRKRKKKYHDKHTKHEDKSRKKSLSTTESDYFSRPRSHDKYRKWRKYEGRSHSSNSSHRHRYS